MQSRAEMNSHINYEPNISNYFYFERKFISKTTFDCLERL